MAGVAAATGLPGSFGAAVAAEFLRARRPPYDIPIVVICNGLLVVLFWLSPWRDIMFTLHGALAFPIVLGSWMYSDVPATNVLAPDRERVLAALDDEPMLLRLLSAKSALLWLFVVPLCVVTAVIIGVAEGRATSTVLTVIAVAILPMGALAVSDWIGILWPYHPIRLAFRWQDRRHVRKQARWLILICAPYGVVPAVTVVVALPAAGVWWLRTGGTVQPISDGLFAVLTLIASLTSLAVWLAGRAGTRRLLRRRHDRLAAYLADPSLG